MQKIGGGGVSRERGHQEMIQITAETDPGGITGKLKMVYIFKDWMIRNRG